MKRVLIIDHDNIAQGLYSRMLQGVEVEIISADTIKKAEKMFEENPDIDAVVINAFGSGLRIDTAPLVRKIKNTPTFKGLMIATSGSPIYAEELVNAGCSCSCEKHLVAQMLCKLLGLSASR